MAKPKAMVLTIREWPLDLHRQMRSQAAIRGVTLRQAIIEACRLWLTTPIKFPAGVGLHAIVEQIEREEQKKRRGGKKDSA